MSYAIAMYFNAHTLGAVKNIGNLNRSLGATAANMARATERVQHIKNFAAGLGNAGRTLTTHVTLPMTALGAVMVRSAGQMEAWELGFSNMLRSTERGRKLLWDLVKLADSTPFVDSAIIGGATQLLGTGLDENEAPALLRKLGDITAGIGGDNNTLFRLIAGTSKALEMGRLNMEALEPFRTAGAGIIQVMADIDFGGDREAMFDEMRKGKVHVDLLYRSLEKMTGESGRFYKAMEKQSQTIPGLWSTLVGKAQTTSALFGDFLVDEYGIKEKIKGISDTIVGLGERVDKMAPAEKKLFAGIITTAYAAGPALMVVTKVIETMLLPVIGLLAANAALKMKGLPLAAIAAIKGVKGISAAALAAGAVFGKAFVVGAAGAIAYGLGGWLMEKFSKTKFGESAIQNAAERDMAKTGDPHAADMREAFFVRHGYYPAAGDTATPAPISNRDLFANLTPADFAAAANAQAKQAAASKVDITVVVKQDPDAAAQVSVQSAVSQTAPRQLVNLFNQSQQSAATAGQ